MLKAYWLRLFLFSLFGGLLGWAISMLAKPKYEAVVDLMIDQKPIVQSMAMSPAESSVSDLIDFSRPRSLATTVQQLVSYSTIDEAAKKVAEKYQVSDTGPGSELYPFDLVKDISVSAEAQSDIVGLRVRHTNSKYAKELATEIFLAFDAENRRNTQKFAEQAIRNLNDQKTLVQKELDTVDAQARDLKSQAGTADLPTQIQADIQAVAALRSQKDLAQMEVSSSGARVSELESEWNSLPQDQNAGKTTALNPVYQKYEDELAAARIKLSDYRSRYTEERPEVMAARQEVWILEALIKKTPKMVAAQSTEAPNDNKKSLRNALADARAAAKAAQGRLEAASTALTERESGMQKLPEIQMQLVQVGRRQQALERLILGYLDRLTSLKAAGVGRLSPSTTVGPTQLNPEPVSPKPMQNAVFGIIGGLLLGVLSMLATEARRQPIRSLAQLNALALRPVYRMVPELRQPFRGLNKAPAEAFDSLLANYLRSTKRPYRVGIVGVTRDAGASTSAMNLAIAGSRHGARVLLIQCDPRGGISRLTGKQPPAPGEFDDASPLIKVTTAESVLTISGDRNPEIRAEVAGHEADITIIDLEPTTQSAEYAFLAPHCDEVILLVRAGRSKSVEFLQAQQALKESGCKLVTVAFTRSSDLAVVTESVERGTQELPTRVIPDEPEA